MKIHNSAIVSKNAKIGENVKIGPYSIVHDNVIIEENTTIDAFCEIGYPTPLADGTPLVIRKNSLIRSHSVFYEGSEFGESLVTGHNVVAREGIQAGKNFQIGTMGDIQGDCLIGNYVKTHSSVFIPKQTQIGDFVWLFPRVILTNDPHPPSHSRLGVIIKDYAIIASNSVVLPGITVNEFSLVGANSLVTKDVPKGVAVAGAPAKFFCETKSIMMKDSGEPAYPWIKHYHEGYPEEIIKKWHELF